MTDSVMNDGQLMLNWPFARNTSSTSVALADVMTGACLSPYPDNPVSIAYRVYTDGGMLRPSWDLGTVAAALLGARAPFAWSEPGDIDIDDMGFTRFALRPDGRHRWLRRSGSAGDAAKWIEALLADAVAAMEADRAVDGN